MDPGQTGYRLDWRVPVPPAPPGTRQAFHNETGPDLRSSMPYGVDCMFHCGGCPAMFHMLWQLHEHLQLHATGGSYHYDHRTRTAFPKYDTACHETQTDDGICNQESKSVDLVCTETQTEDCLTNFFTGRADIEESTENEKDLDVRVKVKLETPEPDLQHENSNVSDELDTDVKVSVLTCDDPYSGDTDEDTNWYPDSDNGNKDLSDSSSVDLEHAQKIKTRKKNLGNSRSFKKTVKEQKKNGKKENILLSLETEM